MVIEMWTYKTKPGCASAKLMDQIYVLVVRSPCGAGQSGAARPLMDATFVRNCEGPGSSRR